MLVQHRTVSRTPIPDTPFFSGLQHVPSATDPLIQQILAVAQFSSPPAPNLIRSAPPEQRVAIGSPDDVARDLERYSQAGRVTHLVMWMHLPGMPASKARRSMELFAKEVMPQFR